MDLLFTSLSIKRLVCLLALTSIAVLIYAYQANPQALWLPLTALLFSLINAGETFPRRLKLTAVTGLAAVAAVFLAGCAASFTTLLAVCLLITTILAMAAAYHNSSYFLPAVIVNLLAILSGGFPPGLAENLHRCLFTVYGILLALSFQLVFLPFYFRSEWRFALLTVIHHLKTLNSEIFSCLLQPEYANNIYLYERRVHLQKMQCIQALENLRAIAVRREPDILPRLDRIYEVMLDYAQLRRRVTDMNTFVVCREEFAAVLRAIDMLFRRLPRSLDTKPEKLDFTPLEKGISRLEESYHNVLQIAAREPLVFLLFIYSLQNLRNELEKLELCGQP